MELEVGIYVRTRHYGIKQIKKIDKISNEHIIYFTGNKYLEDYEISKASFNIIDLIEVGDYVNGRLVEKKFPKIECAEQSIKLKGSSDYIYDTHVKSIVTHQQFDSVKYEVN